MAGEKSSENGGRGSYPEYPRIAVGAAVFKDDKVLLVLRAKPPAEGLWAIPGGSVELGETLREAAEREILEETGLVVRAGDPFFTFEIIDTDESGAIRYHYVIVDLEAEYVSGEPTPGDDALEVRWFSRNDLKRRNIYRRTLNALEEKFGFRAED